MEKERKGKRREGEEKEGRKEGSCIGQMSKKGVREEGGMALTPSLARSLPSDVGQGICQREKGLSVDGILWQTATGHFPAQFYILAALYSDGLEMILFKYLLSSISPPHSE